MDDSGIYNLVCAFDIEEGQLDGFDSKESFCLGVEFGIIYKTLKRREVYEGYMRSANIDRVRKACQEGKALASFSFLPGDKTEDWVWLKIIGYGT